MRFLNVCENVFIKIGEKEGYISSECVHIFIVKLPICVQKTEILVKIQIFYGIEQIREYAFQKVMA